MNRASTRLTLLASVFALLLGGAISAFARPQASAATQTPAAPLTPLKVSAIQIDQIQAEDIKLPAEFQMAMYEHVIEQVAKTKRFEHVYRDGDHHAADVPDLITLRCTVTGFKKGSAEARQVTTVAGATSVTVHLEFVGKNGQTLFANDVKGKVRFFGENMRATFDFGKKVAAVVRQDFAASTPAHKS